MAALSCLSDRKSQSHRGVDNRMVDSLYLLFVVYEKALDTVDRLSIWNILGHYVVPETSASSNCSTRGSLMSSMTENSRKGLRSPQE